MYAMTMSEARNRELTLRVKGMTCAGCAATVRRALEARPGVRSASVSVSDGRAHIQGDHLDPSVMIQAVRDRGYEAEPIEGEQSAADRKSDIEHHHQEHERLWRRRAIVGLSLWLPLEVLHWSPLHHLTWAQWVMLIGSTIVLIAAGGGFYASAWKAATKKTTNMDTLIAMGATTAYVFSLIVFIMQRLGRLGDQPLYFAEAAALLGIISLGHWIEARASSKAGSAVRELLQLQPDEAELIDERGETRTVRSADVHEGDRLLIRPGGRVPVDGQVVEGESDLDESIVTGEPLPVRRAAGDQVIAGSLNTTGRLVIRATVDGRHTTISRIAEMVQRAQSSKADIQKLADRVSAIFVPAVLAIALATVIGWWIAGDPATGVIATVTVLIISCPCALGLATPMAVMVGAGAAARRGILIKSAIALEVAGRAKHVVFDKTGTLTRGEPVVTEVRIANPLAPGSAGRTNVERSRSPNAISESEMLRLTAAVEAPSEHPIARAIVNAARERSLQIPPVDDFQAIPGEGVRGRVGGSEVVVKRGDEVTCTVEVDGVTIGSIIAEDALRDDAADAIRELKSMGVKVWMLTGDKRANALQIAAQLGIDVDSIGAESSPQTKVDFVRGLAGQGVVMVGDGINDAAALAEADLGIAMASGTNIAIESADVVIPGDQVAAVAETIMIARRTLKTIKQNLFFAFMYNALAIPAAAFGWLGLYGPLIAAAAMGLSDITVIGNALRLKASLRGTNSRSQRRNDGTG